MSEQFDDRRYERSRQFPRFMILVMVFDMIGIAIIRGGVLPIGPSLILPLTVAVLVLTTIPAYWLTYRGGIEKLNPWA